MSNISAQHALGFQTFLPEGHISSCTTVRGPDILRNAIVSGYSMLHSAKSGSS